jgi:GH15 family glucan-1,4-alpha-glucosidase
MRVDDYAPIEDYAVVGDGRCAALVALDGSVDWLCVPDFDSPSIFGRILDAKRGGFFSITPTAQFEAERSYRPGSNVLETTFRTADGVARVTDALTLSDRSTLAPLRELARRVEVLAGEVELEWRFEPRPGYARSAPSLERRAGGYVCASGSTALSLSAWDAGEIRSAAGSAGARVRLRSGERSVLAMTVARHEPLVFPSRGEVETRLDHTDTFWRRWSERTRYDGPWLEAVGRSALALKLLVFAPSGAVVAAPTTSLPERVGGERNWDYRYTWVRDASYTLVALRKLGHEDEARAFFWWLAHATALTHPRLQVLYRLTGGVETRERTLDHLDGYRGSSPVRVGNDARSQTQLDVYGAMLDAVWQSAAADGAIEGVAPRALAKIADWVADNWGKPDSGFWEVRSEPAHFTQSKAMCWVALDRACRLAERGLIPDRTARWREAARAVAEFIETRCWDDELGSYVRAPGLRELDASLLTLSLFDYPDPNGNRLSGTIEAVERDLRKGPYVWRYRRGDSREGAFVACSFWLAAALARTGRVADATTLVDELLGLANDVGLWSEEAAPDGSFLGNFPQALSHLAFVSAALAVQSAENSR